MRTTVNFLLFLAFLVMGILTMSGYISSYADGAPGKQGLADFFNHMEDVLPGFNSFFYFFISFLCGFDFIRELLKRNKD